MTGHVIRSAVGLLARARELVVLNHGHWRGAIRLALAQAEWLLGRLDAWLGPDPGQVKRLVFVCLGNINRSAYAHAVARRLGAHCVSIGLATTTGAPAYSMAITQAGRFGVDLSGHRATDITDYRYVQGDLLLAMEVRHVHRLIKHGIPSGAIALLGFWATPRRLHLHDPHLLPEPYFATCFTVIESAVRRLVAQYPAVAAQSREA